MKKLIGILMAFAVFATGAVAQVQVKTWQELQPYIAAQTGKLNTHTDEIAALQAENAVLKSDLVLVIQRYDMLLRYLVVHACATNGKIETINSVFSWVRPFPLGSHECPPAGSRYYIPGFLSASGPPIPPDLTDDFDRADGPAGANWSAGNVVGNKLRVLGTALWKPALAADQFVEARMWASSTTEWGYHGLVVRATDGSKIQYRFTISVNENKFGLEYMDAAGQHHSLLAGPVTYKPGATMRLNVKGGKLTAYYDFVKLGEVDDTRIAGGSVGVIGLAGTGQHAEFSAFVAGAL